MALNQNIPTRRDLAGHVRRRVGIRLAPSDLRTQ